MDNESIFHSLYKSNSSVLSRGGKDRDRTLKAKIVRQEKRNARFEACRKFSPISTEKDAVKIEMQGSTIQKVENKKESYQKRYLAWKEARRKKQLEEMKNRKKPFVSACSSGHELSFAPKNSIYEPPKLLKNLNENKRNILLDVKQLKTQPKCKPVLSKATRSPIFSTKKLNTPLKKEKLTPIPIVTVNGLRLSNEKIKKKENLKPNKFEFPKPGKYVKTNWTSESNVIAKKHSIAVSNATKSSGRMIDEKKKLHHFIAPKMPMKNVKPISRIHSTKLKTIVKKPNEKKKQLLISICNEANCTPIEITENPYNKFYTSTQKKSNSNLSNISQIESIISPIDTEPDFLIDLAPKPRSSHLPSPLVVRKKKSSLKYSENKVEQKLVNSPLIQTMNKKEKSLRDDVCLDAELRRVKEEGLRFRKIVDDETERLEKLCNAWELCLQQDDQELLDEHGGRYMISATIGQTNLLLRGKFTKFRNLIEKFENFALKTEKDEKLIHSDDLEGFWSVICLDIENIDKRFTNLKEWKDNNWRDPDEQRVIQKSINKIPKVIKKSKEPVGGDGGKSRFKDYLKKLHAENMKSKKQNNCTKLNGEMEISVVNESETNLSAIRRSKRFSAGMHLSSVEPSLSLRRNSKRMSTAMRISPVKSSPAIIRSGKRISSAKKNCTNYANVSMKEVTTPRKTPRKWQCISLEQNIETSEIFHTPLRELPKKSILKTPGTLKKNRNVLFSEKLDYHSPELMSKHSRSLTLRSRKITVDPTAYIEIP